MSVTVRRDRSTCSVTFQDKKVDDADGSDSETESRRYISRIAPASGRIINANVSPTWTW